MRRSALAPLAAAMALVLLVACSDDDSASSQVCDARSDLRESVRSVADDAANGDFGEARDGLDDVSEDYDELRSAVDDLADDEREEISPQVDDLQSQIDDLADASSIEDLGSQAGDVVDGVESIVSEIGDELDCS